MPAPPKAILEELLKHLGFTATIVEQPIEGGLMLDVKMDDPGRLIGRQGQTLTDLQYLTNRLCFHLDPQAPRLTVDVGGYRAEAREALLKRAREAAEKVRRWGDVVEFEPMHAYDRYTIHQALKDDPTVETSSAEVEGTDKKAVLVRRRRA